MKKTGIFSFNHIEDSKFVSKRVSQLRKTVARKEADESRRYKLRANNHKRLLCQYCPTMGNWALCCVWDAILFRLIANRSGWFKTPARDDSLNFGCIQRGRLIEGELAL